MIELNRRGVLTGAAAVTTAAVMDQFSVKPAHAAIPLKLGVNSMIEGGFRGNPSSQGNFEALLLDGKDLWHYWRDNSAPGFPWHRSVMVSSATGPACLIESSFRGNPTAPGNFEALVLQGSNLVHYWRDNSTPGLLWHSSVVVSTKATGPASLIQSSFRSNPNAPGNFEALVLEGSNLVHYFRDNSTPGFPWHSTVAVSTSATGPACLIQSSFRGTPSSPGNFEALVLEGGKLVHYWRDNSTPGLLWHSSVVVSASPSGPASFIQNGFRGTPTSPGNFEALVPQGPNLEHYWRANWVAGFPWYSSTVVDAVPVASACLIEGTFRSAASAPGNFEALVQESADAVHYWRDNSVSTLPWHRGVVI